MTRNSNFFYITALIPVITSFSLPALGQGMGYIMPVNQGQTAQSYAGQAFQNQGYPSSGFQQPYQNPNYSAPGFQQPYQNSSVRIPRSNLYNQSTDYCPGNSLPTNNFPTNNFPVNSPPVNNDQIHQLHGYVPPSPPGMVITPAMHMQAAELTNHAYDLCKAGNNEQAIELLKQAITIDPNSSIAHLNMAVSLIALKRYNEALHESSIVLQLDPNDEKGYLDYLAAAIGANQMSDALRVGQEYLQRFPEGKNRSKLTNEMFAIEHELDRRANTKGIMAPAGSPDNYLVFVTPYGKQVWPSYLMPLKVYIYPGQGSKGFLPAFETVLIKSFLTWQNASQGLVRFVPVDNPDMANVVCKWTDSTADLDLAAEAGDAKVDSGNNGISHATITLLTLRPGSPKAQLSETLLQQVCLHEIGHALGLSGHSDSAQDIMYCATDSNVEYAQISQRDLNTLFLLYQ